MELVIENEYLKVMSCFRIMEKKEQMDKMKKMINIIEDKVLKKRVLDYIEKMNQLPDETQMTMYKDRGSSQRLIEALHAKRALQNYLEKVIEGKKPYWQILAEQNGWGPKGE